MLEIDPYQQRNKKVVKIEYKYFRRKTLLKNIKIMGKENFTKMKNNLNKYKMEITQEQTNPKPQKKIL